MSTQSATRVPSYADDNVIADEKIEKVNVTPFLA
jgi:hypothetical protein